MHQRLFTNVASECGKFLFHGDQPPDKESQDSKHQTELQNLVESRVPVAEGAAVFAHIERDFEQLADHAAWVALVIGRAGGGHHVLAQPVVEPLCKAIGHRALHITEQHDAVAV